MTSTRTRRRRTAIATASLILLFAALASACRSSSSAASTDASPPNDTAGAPDPTSTIEGSIPVASVALPSLLVGDWLAENFITVGALRPVPDDLAAGIRFRGGPTVEIETGCSHGSALVAFASDSTFGTTLVLSDLTLTPAGKCDDRAADVERHILELLGHPLSWDVRDGQLKLLPTDITDSGLILRSAAAESAPVAGTVAALLAVAADHRIRMANGFDTPNVFSSVAILRTYGVANDDGALDSTAGPVPVPDDVRQAIEMALGPITVQWVAAAADVPTEPTATWDEQPLPALLTLAEPVINGERATVVSDLRCEPGCVIGGGQAFNLGADGSWAAVGPVGLQWQS